MLLLQLLTLLRQSIIELLLLLIAILRHYLQLLAALSCLLVTLLLQSLPSLILMSLVPHCSRVLGLSLLLYDLLLIFNVLLHSCQMFFTGLVCCVIECSVFLLRFIVMVFSGGVKFHEFSLTVF